MRILVIEDSQKHYEDAMNYAKQLINCEVDFTTTLDGAIGYLTERKYDGVISDVFFPKSKNYENAPITGFENALIVSDKCLEMGIHLVFNTAGNHNGMLYGEFFCKTPKAIHNNIFYHFLTTGMLIEACPRDSDGEKDTKQWEAAFRYIILALTLIALPDKREKIIKKMNILGFPFMGFPYGDYGELTTIFRNFMDPTSKEFNSFVAETFKKYNA